MTDKFERYDTVLDSPGKSAFNVTPNNSANLTYVSRGIYIGTTGNINCIFVGDSANTLLANLPTGGFYSFRIAKIWATGTTADNIVAIY